MSSYDKYTISVMVISGCHMSPSATVNLAFSSGFPRLNRTISLLFFPTTRIKPLTRPSFFHKRMVSTSMPDLPTVQGTDPSKCVLESFRIAIAKRLSEALSLSLEQAYAGVNYGKKGDDFTVALPRYRLPGSVDEIASKVLEKVRPVVINFHSS